MRLSAISARRLVSGSASAAVQASGSKRAERLTRAAVPRHSQIRSGFIPMIE